MENENSKKTIAKLILSDGSEFKGYSLGAEGTVIGEIVFTTGMTGYLETLTDPSYFGQIVIQTFPLIGNYGVNEADVESEKPWLSGYVVRNYCKNPSNFRSKKTLNEWLKENKIISIQDIDTRQLTKKIRENGVMNGAITTEKNFNKESLLSKIKEFKIEDAVKTVSVPEKKELSELNFKNIEGLPKIFKGQKRNFKICLIDFGAKKNILKSLAERGADLIIVPYNATAEQIKEIKPDGIMLSNGPGDPTKNSCVIENLKQIQKLKIPIFGICLGHQLLALANGAKTEKLKYGHRGANQPVLDLQIKRTFITTQNHGYAVIGDSISNEIGFVSHYNANDKTCEGIEYKNIPAFTVQFHPEACAGPQDTAYLFDRFFEIIDRNKKIESGV